MVEKKDFDSLNLQIKSKENEISELHKQLQNALIKLEVKKCPK